MILTDDGSFSKVTAYPGFAWQGETFEFLIRFLAENYAVSNFWLIFDR